MLIAGLSGVGPLLDASEVAAQAGATLTPDRLTYLVNKDVGSERWTIGLNLGRPDGATFLNVTGNVFRSDGGPPSFIVCQVREDSTGSLTDPTSSFRLTCRGSGACEDTASACSRLDWEPINRDIQLPAGFFLPPGGARPSAAAGADRVVSRAGAESTVGSGAGGSSPRGATLGPDGFNHLINKDVGDERWSISLNFVPTDTGEGLRNELRSVTGNVFRPGGAPPVFIYCTERADSQGDLAVPSSRFRLSCSGTDPCPADAETCAATSWRTISDLVELSADFFLPPGGLPAPPASDSGVLVGVGRRDDPGSIPALTLLVGTGKGCPVGETCSLRVGNCSSVPGRFVQQGAGCGCQVQSVPGQCLLCAGGDTSACGAGCSFPVGFGGALARGQCRPYTSITPSCICLPGAPPPGCGGPLNVGCPSDTCCADDPTDGCDQEAGDVACAGLCVQTESCDPSTRTCGICFGPNPPS
jgi:hypothetical protein